MPPTLADPKPHSDLAKRENDWAMFTHLSGLVGFLGIPSFLGPLILWLIKKDEFNRVDTAGKEALNFHLTMLIFELLSIPLLFVFGLGILSLIAVSVLTLVFTIVAAVSTNRGEDYVYPISFRMIK